MSWELLINPKSKRLIRKGSVLHMKLIKEGVMGIDGEDLTKKECKEEEKVERVIRDRKVIKYSIKKL